LRSLIGTMNRAIEENEAATSMEHPTYLYHHESIARVCCHLRVFLVLFYYCNFIKFIGGAFPHAKACGCWGQIFFILVWMSRQPNVSLFFEVALSLDVNGTRNHLQVVIQFCFFATTVLICLNHIVALFKVFAAF